jgi:deazaflavin-dependent oxidoreductase (nitroreductase family)
MKQQAAESACVRFAPIQHYVHPVPGERFDSIQVCMPIQATPEGTYGTTRPKWLRKLFDSLVRRQIASYRRNGGMGRMGRFIKRPIVLLTTTGARSGLERTVAINAIADGDGAWLVIASHAGSASHPAWFKNMVQHPEAIWLEVGSRKMKVRGDSLTGNEREEAFGRITAVIKTYAGYQRKTDREIPIVRLTRLSD